MAQHRTNESLNRQRTKSAAEKLARRIEAPIKEIVKKTRRRHYVYTFIEALVFAFIFYTVAKNSWFGLELTIPEDGYWGILTDVFFGLSLLELVRLLPE